MIRLALLLRTESLANSLKRKFSSRTRAPPMRSFLLLPPPLPSSLGG